MYHYKSDDDEGIAAERHDLIWQMLTAQLEASHEKLMAQYGLEVAEQARPAEDSPLRGPRTYAALPAPAPRQLTGPRPAGPLRGGR